MGEEKIMTANGGSYPALDGDAPDFNPPTAPVAPDPTAGDGVVDPGTGAPPEALSTSIAKTPPFPVSSRSYNTIKGIEEIVRSGKTEITSWKPPFVEERGFENCIADIKERAALVAHSPVQGIPAPSGASGYQTSKALFFRLQQAIATQAPLSKETSTLAAYWVLSTWFSDGLPLAPGLAITGSAYEGDLVLRTLRNYCRCPLVLTRAEIATLKNVKWRIAPTLLLCDPNVTKQMAALLGCTATRGHLVSDAGHYRDFYGPKAIYLGEKACNDRIPHCSVQVNLLPVANVCGSAKASQLSELEVQDLQNQLFGCRLENLARVYNSDFDASSLTSDTRAVTSALGACIVNAPELQSQLISLLTPLENQRQADRSTGLDAVILEATLSLCHQGKRQFLVGEIATEVNRFQKTRGERLILSAEKVGHLLKKFGMTTHRLGKAGKGLVMDSATIGRIHELAVMYGGAGLERDEGNLHCSLCAENTRLM